MEKFCSVCGNNVKDQEVDPNGYVIYLMYQVVERYEKPDGTKKEMRTQPIKYICEDCRAHNKVEWSGTQPTAWREING